jgi:hypothetical protein
VLAVGGILVAVGYGLIALAVASIGVTGSVLWTLPGLVIAGWGMGMVIMPVTPLVLAGVQSDHAAAAGGVLSTAQEGGNALGVAVVGSVFFSLLGTAGRDGFPAAFELSLAVLAVPGLIVAVLAQLLPRAESSA